MPARGPDGVAALSLAVITRREASIFACLIDAVVAPEPKLPPVRETDAVEFLDDWLARSPALNRIGMRVLLYVAEVAPLALGPRRTRLRRLDRTERAQYIRALQRAPHPQLRLVWKLVRTAAQLAYYGDANVLLRLGYDPDANLRRGWELRAREGRP